MRKRQVKNSGNPFEVAGLFAGIGGLELGLSRSGHHTNIFCEIETAAAHVLHTRFSDVRIHNDVRTLRSLPSSTELVTAGFPCQDLSQAGKTAGIDGSRSGLIGEIFRLLRKHRAPWVILENVPFMLQLSRGRAMEVIVASLEELGYKWAYRVIDSHAFGVPQRRERVYLVACLEGDPRDVVLSDDAGKPAIAKTWSEVPCGFYWTEGVRGLGWAVDAVPTLKGGSAVGIPSPPAIIFPSGMIAKPDIRDAERMQGFSAGWTQCAEEVVKTGMRWKLVGNAVMVDAAAWIGKKLREPSQYNSGLDLPLYRHGSWPRAAWSMGRGAHVSHASPWPIRKESIGLASFLKFPIAPLSPKATAGFLSRTEQGSLRFPPGFIAALQKHLDQVTSSVAA